MSKGAVKKTIKNMIGGVSEQPPLQRLESQCEEMVNCQPGLTEFLRRRNGVKTIKNIANVDTNNLFIDFIERGDNEVGMVTVNKNGVVTVYNLNGEQIGSPVSNEYLKCNNPKEDIKLCTVRDYNFLLNNKKVVGEGSYGGVTFPNKHMVFIKQAQYDQEYTVKIGDTTISYRTPANDNGGYKLSAEAIANELVKLLEVDNSINYSIKYSCEHSLVNIDNLNPKPPHTSIFGQKEAPPSECGVVMEKKVSGTNRYTKEKCRAKMKIVGYMYDDALHSTPPPLEPDFANIYHKYGIIIIDTESEVSVYDGMGETMLTVFNTNCYSISDLPVYAPQGYVLKVAGDVTRQEDDYYVEFVTEKNLPQGEIGRGGWKETKGQDVGDNDFNLYTMPHKLIINTNSISLSDITWNARKAGNTETNPLPSFAGKTIRDIFFYKNRLGFITDDTVVLSEAGEYFNFYQTTMLALLDSDPIDIAISGTKVSPLKYVVPYAEGLFLYTDRSLYVLEYGEVLSTANVELKPVLQFDTSLSAEPVVCDTSIYYAGKRGNSNQIREYKPTQANDQYGYSNNITSHIPDYIQGNIHKILISLEQGMMLLINSTETVYCYSFFKDNQELLMSSWHKWKFNYPVLSGLLFNGYLYLVFKKSNGISLGKISIANNDNHYLDDGQDYISSFTYSPYFIRDNSGKVLDIPTKIRTMALKYTSDSEFKVVINRENRSQEIRRQDKRRDFTRFLIASDNKKVEVIIESEKGKPFSIIETDLEVIYASRS